jgi:hypothetical protein
MKNDIGLGVLFLLLAGTLTLVVAALNDAQEKKFDQGHFFYKDSAEITFVKLPRDPWSGKNRVYTKYILGECDTIKVQKRDTILFNNTTIIGL